MLYGIVLAQNVSATIQNALLSLAFCDTLIVIDDNSNDTTVEIAERHKARVIVHTLNNNFAKQRNYAMSLVKNGDWIIFLDADEVVSDELERNIKQAILNNDAHAYYIKRRDYFWGKELRWGETRSAREKGIVRLVKKGFGAWEGAVHEVYLTDGPTLTLSGFINHYPHKNVHEFILSINRYSSIRSIDLVKRGKKIHAYEVFVFPMAKFIYTFFIKLGYKDGAEGFVYSFMMSFHSFLVRAKAYAKTT